MGPLLDARGSIARHRHLLRKLPDVLSMFLIDRTVSSINNQTRVFTGSDAMFCVYIGAPKSVVGLPMLQKLFQKDFPALS